MKSSKKGLGWVRWVDPIESFVSEYAQLTPRWAVICTYECEMDRLEQDVLPLLARRGRAFRTVVFADAGVLQKRLKPGIGKTPAGRMNLYPVRLLHGGVFHPKVVLLRAGNRVRVCFGSANVTSGGMGRNLELWAHSDDPEITSAFMDFFDKLGQDNNIALDPPSRRSLERALTGLDRCNSRLVWTSLDEPFIGRLKGNDSGLAGAKAVHLLSPAYVSKGGAKAVLESFRGLQTTIYTDGVIAHGKAKLLRYNPPHPSNAESSPEEENMNTPLPSKLHAKAYLFEGRKEAVLWFGSANLTVQALVRSVRTKGNVEILVKTKVPGAELRACISDLNRLFSSNAAPDQGDKPAPEPKAAQRGVVLSGELQDHGGALQLVIHTLPDVRSVRLVLRGSKKTVAKIVVIKNSRGVIEGISHLLPELRDGRNGDDWTALIYEVVGKELIPVIVNVPFVAEPSKDGPAAEEAMDGWIDEFLGRWPPRSRIKMIEPVPRISDEEEEETQSSDEEDERRLDEANHQGALDRLAVKAAILKKRIASAPTTGGYHQALERAIAKSLLNACEPHLQPVITSWFAQPRGRKEIR
jgi:hypothetical protein